MSSRSFADVAPTSATLALNAAFTGYGGHSLLTPHYAIKQLWWTEERIRNKVTLHFVTSRLTGEERDFLNRPLSFGDGLTDQTYLEWILERAKRLFLILAEIGLPDQIFGCIDDSWDDDDLPIALDVIPTLELSSKANAVINKKFYNTQFIYLLRELQAGSHIDYGPKEHIPMEHVNTRPPAVTLQAWDRIHLPDRPADVYVRRKYALADSKSDSLSRESFLHDVEKAQQLPHEHIAPVFASYTSDDAAYTLSSFVGEHTLSTFIEHRMSASYQRLSAADRPALLLEWMHCLSDVLAFLHHKGVAHTAIRPSNILISHDNRIAFADIGSLGTFQKGKKASVTEMYDYAAPESKLASSSVFEIPPQLCKKPTVRRLRKLSTSTVGSSSSSSTGHTISRDSSASPATSAPAGHAPPEGMRCGKDTDAVSPLSYSSASFYSASRPPTRCSTIPSIVSQSPRPPQSPFCTPGAFSNTTRPNSESLRDLPVSTPQMSDVFSLGCVYLDIVTFMLRGRFDAFIRHRTSRVKSSLSKNKTVRVDTSFHYDSEKILSWMAVLEEEAKDAKRRIEQIYRGVPDLLRLIRRMLQQNATLRPSAMEIRDEVQQILADVCGLSGLCCTDRDWSIPMKSTAPTGSEQECEYINKLHDSVDLAPLKMKEEPSADDMEDNAMHSSTLDAPEMPVSPYLNTLRDSISTNGSIAVIECSEVVVKSVVRSEAAGDAKTAGGARTPSKISSVKPVAAWRRAFSRSS